VDVNALKESAIGVAARSRARAALVVSEVAFSLVLLVCASLLMQTLTRLHQVETGFNTSGLVVVRTVKYIAQAVTLRGSAAALSEAHARVIGALEAIPGVAAASVTNGLAFTGPNRARPCSGSAVASRSSCWSRTPPPTSRPATSAPCRFR
jgi:hypothetical protein